MTDLATRYLTLCDSLGVDEPLVHWKILKGFYGEANRHYHNFSHIEAMLKEFDQHKKFIDWSTAVEWAIFWHDAFYQTKLTAENERLSAKMSLVPISHRSPEFQARVTSLIMATDHKEPPKFQDAEWLCDFDLAILSSDDDAYRDYANRIRHEYHWVPLDEYRPERIKVLKGFLDRDRIYNTGPYRENEGKARDNIQDEIVALGG